MMRLINKLLTLIGIQINRTQSIKNVEIDFKDSIHRLARYYLHFNQKVQPPLNTDIVGIVFSKDRAMQLHALLSSYFFYVKNPAPLSILFTFSNENHKKAYKILEQEFRSYNVLFIEEQTFDSQLKEMLKGSFADRVFFMTDDGIFLDHFDLSDCLRYNPLENIFSLRLGGDFDFCYTYNIKQRVPIFSGDHKDGLNSWVWAYVKDSPDWTYPLSVDATIFWKVEILKILELIEFSSPNSLESQMQLYSELFLQRKGICYDKAKYVNIPCNIVQKEFENVTTGTFSTGELLELYLAGKRINWRLLQNVKPREAQLTKFSFINN